MKKCLDCDKLLPINNFGKNKNTKDGLSCYCFICARKRSKISKEKMFKLHPWYTHYAHAKLRCNNKNNSNYKYYGGKGIQFLLTENEVKELWFRDKAYLMKQPSIDRINNDGNYEYNNCRFIELKQNIYRVNSKRFRKILQYDLQDNFIKEWNSLAQAGKVLKISIGNIYSSCNNIRVSAGGFKWRYK